MTGPLIVELLPGALHPASDGVCIYIYIYIYMGGCQNYGPFLGTPNIRCRIILGTQKGTIILTATHSHIYIYKEICFIVFFGWGW